MKIEICPNCKSRFCPRAHWPDRDCTLDSQQKEIDRQYEKDKKGGPMLM